MQIIGLLVLGIVAFGVIYAFVVRPWHLKGVQPKTRFSVPCRVMNWCPSPSLCGTRPSPSMLRLPRSGPGWYRSGTSAPVGTVGMGFTVSWGSPAAWTIRVVLQPDHPGASRPGGRGRHPHDARGDGHARLYGRIHRAGAGACDPH